MTAPAGGSRLGQHMRSVAVQAVRYGPVTIVAGGTEKPGMGAFGLLHLFSHLGVTGKTFHTGRLGRVSQGDQRPVRISMAVQAVFYLIVRLPRMALFTGGYRAFLIRGMLPGMAVKAAQLRMLFAGVPDRLDFKRMTLNAIPLRQ